MILENNSTLDDTDDEDDGKGGPKVMAADVSSSDTIAMSSAGTLGITVYVCVISGLFVVLVAGSVLYSRGKKRRSVKGA